MKKRFLQLTLLTLVIISCLEFTIALESNSINGPSWLVKLIDFLNWGNTWQEVVIMIFVLVILFVIIYNSLTLFSLSKGFVRVILAFSISVLATTQVGLSGIYIDLMKFVGDFFVLFLFGLIIIAIVLFVISGWIRGKIAVSKMKDLSENLKLAHEIDRIKRKTI